MKKTAVWLMSAMVILMTHPAWAASKYFSYDAATNIWDTSSAFWGTSSGGPYNATWSSNDAAVFEGTSGAVSLSATQTANSVTFLAGGYLVSNATLTLTAPATVSNDVSAAISSVIAGSAGLVKVGVGTLTLSGVNTYTGNTTNRAGVLVIDGAGKFGNGTYVGVITNSATLVHNSSAPQTFSGIINGAGSLVQSGSGTLTLSGANTFTGGLVIKVGTVSGLTSAGAFGATASVITLGDGSGSANATLNGGLAGTFANPISVASGNTGLVTVTDSAASIFSGAVTLNSHDLILSPAASALTLSGGVTGTGTLTLNATGAGAITLSIGSVNPVGQVINVGGGAGAVTISAVVGTNVTGVIQNSLTSTLNFTTSVNTYTSGLTIKAGTVSGAVANSFGANANVITLGDSSGSTNVALTGAGAVTFANPISVASGNSGVATITDTAASIFSGPVTLNNHDLKLSPAASALTLSGGVTGNGTLTLNATGAGAITLSTGSINPAGQLINSGTGAGAVTVSAVIGSNVTAVIQNSATSVLTLSGSNTYSGTTTINAGQLVLNNGQIAGGGAVSLAAAATLSGNGTITDTVTPAAGAFILAGGSNVVGTMTLGALTLPGGYTNVFDVAALGASNDIINIGGTLTAGGSRVALNLLNPNQQPTNGTYRLFSYGSLNGGFDVTVLGNTSQKSWAIDTSVSGQVNLVVSGSNSNLVWNPTDASSNVWNTFANASWTNTDLGIASVFGDGDTVTFDDTGVAYSNGVVNIAATVRPASVTVNAAGNYAFGGTGKISGLGGLVKDGAGTLTISNSGGNDYTGGVMVTNGVLRAASGSALGAGSVSVANGAALELAGGVTLVRPLALVGAGISGAGVVRNVSSNNTYSGAITPGGAIRINSDAGTVTLSAATLASGGFGVAFGGAGNGAISSIISGSGSLTKDGAGTLTLTGSSTYTGVTLVSQGVLVLGVGSSLSGSGSAITVASGATMTLSGGVNNQLPVNPTFTVNGALLANTAIAHTFPTNGVLNNGTLASTVGTATYGVYYAGTAPATTITASGASNTISAVNFGIASGVTLNLVTPTVADVLTASSTFGVSGSGLAGGITKSGSGTVILTGTNVYTGTTIVNGGTLSLGATGLITNNSSITVSAGTVFDVSAVTGGYILWTNQTLQGNGTVNGNITARGNTKFYPGLNGSVGTLTCNSNLTLNATTTNVFDFASLGASNDVMMVGGNLVAGGSVIAVNFLNAANPMTNGTYTLFTYGGTLSGSFSTNIPGNTSRKVWTIDTNTAGQVNLVVSGSVSNLVWYPSTASSNLWNVLDKQSWTNIDVGAVSAFADGDAVSFDDTGAAYNSGIVNVAVTVRPGSLSVNSTSNYTFSGLGKISGNTGLAKDGPGILTNSTVSDYTGDTTISGGTLVLGGAGVLGGGAYAGNITNNAALVYGSTAAQTFSGIISGSGPLTKTINGSLTLGGGLANTCTGLTTVNNISSGTAFNPLILNKTAGVTAIAGDVKVGGGSGTGYATLQVSASEQIADSSLLTIDATTASAYVRLTGANETLAGITAVPGTGAVILECISGASQLTISNSVDFVYNGFLRSNGGTLSLVKNGTGAQSLCGANITYTGDTLVNAGALILSNATAFASAVTINGGQLVLSTTVTSSKNVTNLVAGALTFNNGAAFTIGGLCGTGDIALTNNTGAAVTLTVGGGNSSGDYSGVLSQGGGLTKTGSGIQTLTGSNIYTGGTTVSGGVLSVGVIADSGMSAISTTGTLTFNGGTLQYTGSGDTTARTIIDTGAATYDIASDGATLTLAGPVSGAGLISKTGLGTLLWSNNTMTVGGLYVLKGTAVMSGVVYTNTTTGEEHVGNASGDNGRLVLTNNSQIVHTGNSWFQIGPISGSTGVVVMVDGLIKSTAASSGMTIGNQANSVGAFYQLGGVVSTVYQVGLGWGAAGAYGYYQNSGGTLTAANWIQVPANGVGAMYQSGGSLVSTVNGLIIGNAGTGVVYQTGGIIGGSQPIYLQYTGSTASRGEFTIVGAGVVNITNSVIMSQAGLGVSIVNLNGGTLQVNRVYENVATGTSIFNFNGGTLKANTGAGANFFQAIDRAYVCPGGVVIDDSGLSIAVSNTLIAASGNGVTGLPWGGNLAGYVGAPYVAISGGGGTGATAVALFDYTSGTVTGVVVTGSGAGYTNNPAVTLKSGGQPDVALGTASIGANTSGGLTKLGTGTLTLTGVNTYAGDTTFNAGMLAIGGAGQLGGGNYAGAISNGGVFVVNSSATQTLSGVISGAGSLVKSGSGTLTLTGANNFIGGTTVNGGLLQVNSASGTGLSTGPVSVNAGGELGVCSGVGTQSFSSLTLNQGGELDFEIGAGTDQMTVTAADSLTINGGTINLYVEGTTSPVSTPGTYNLIAYSGSIGGAGVFSLLINNPAPGVSYGFSAAAGWIKVTVRTASALAWNGGGADANWPTSGNWGGTAPFEGDTLVFGAAGATQLNNTNSYTPFMRFNGITFSNSVYVLNGAPIRLADNVINTTPTNETINLELALDGWRVFDTGIGNVTVGGEISELNGSWGPTKAGSGTLALTGINSFTGPLAIQSGTVMLDGVGQLNSGNYPGAISNAAVLIYSSTAAQTLGGVISGAGSLTKAETSTLVLTGANTFSGGTTISAGALQIAGTAGTFGVGPVAIGGNTLQISRSNASTITNDLSGTGTVEKYVANISTYAGTSTLTGTIQQKAEGGTFALAPGSSMTGLATVNQDSNLSTTWNVNGTLSAANFYGANVGANFTSKTVTFNVNAGGSATIGTMSISTMGWVQDSNPTTTINVNSGGTLTATTIQGQGNGGGSVGYKRVRRYINITGGQVNATTINLSAGGTGDYVNEVRRVTLNNGTLANISGGNLTVDATTVVMLTGNGIFNVDAGRSITANGTVTSSGGLVKTGAGTLFLTHAANSYTGNTTINDGTLTLSGTGLLGSGNYSGTITNNGGFVYNSSTNQTLSGVMSGTGALTQLGSGVLTLAAANSYSGDTVISASTLVQAASNSLSANSVHTLGTSATLNTGNFPGSVLALGGGGTLNLAGAAANLTIVDGRNLTFSGTIIGAGALTKAGASALTLTGANSFNGGTVVSGGTLTVTSTSGLGSNSGLTIMNGASFLYFAAAPGSLTLGSGALNLSDGSRIGTMMGGTPGQSAITSSGAATAAGTITVDIRGIPGASVTTGTNDLITAGSGLTAGGATYVLGNCYNVGNFAGTLVATDTAISFLATSLDPLTNAYWKGGFATANNTWAISDGSTAGNWASDQAGTATPLVPGGAATVIFSSTGAVNQDAMVLGASMGIAGMVVNDSTAVTLNADGNVLTLGAGGVTVNSGAGVVTLGSAIALGSSQTWSNDSVNALTVAGNVANGGFPLTSSGAGVTVVTGVLGGTGGVVKTGTGTLNLSGVNTFTGNITNRVGTLMIGGAGSLGNGTYAGAITNSAALVHASSVAQTLSGIISGSGYLMKSGNGTLTLSGGNTFTGAVSNNVGTIKVANINAFGAVNTAVTKVIVGGGAAIDFNGVGATYGYTISGSGPSGTGALVNMGSAIGTGSAQASNIKLAADAAIGGTGDWALLASGYAATTLDLGGFTLTKTGGNTFTLCNTTINAGTLSIAGGTVALHASQGTVNGSAANVVLGNNAGATLNLNGKTLTVAMLQGGGTTGGNVILGAGTLTINQSAVSTYSGVISGTGGLVKLGAGSLILGGTNSYTGATTITNGILVVNGSLAAASAVAVNAGGTLGGSGTVNGTVTANAGSTLAPGYGVGTLMTGNLVLNAGCTNAFEFDSGAATNDVIAVLNNNGLTINGGMVALYQSGTTNAWTTAGTYTLMTFVGSWNGNGSFQVANPVPGLNYYFNTVGNTIQLTIINSGTSVWTGTGTNDLWQTQDNWGGVAPVSGSLLVFDTSVRTLNTNDFDAGTYFSMLFTNTAGSFTLNGSPVALIGDVVNLSSNAQTINNDVTLGSDTRNILATGPVTLSGVLSGGGIVKTGTGTLSLTGNNNYSGMTTVKSGTLKVNNSSGSATGNGAVTVNSGAVLGGSGTISGPVVVSAGGAIASGNGVGTLSAGNLTLAAGSTNIVEFDVSGSNDTVVLAGGLTNNGCAVQLSTNGMIGPWSQPGTYTLFQFTGTIGGAGLAGFSVANPVAGLTYYFTTNGTSVQVIIGGLPSWTGSGADNNWTTGGNWVGGAAPAPGRSLVFGTFSRLVNSNDFTAGTPFGITFTNTAGSFMLNGNPIALSGDVVNLSTNTQTINNDLVLNTGVRTMTNAVTGPMTVNGAISGTYGLAKVGSGTVTLAGSNVYSGVTTINGGVLNLSGTGTLPGGVVVNNSGSKLMVSGTLDTVAGGVQLGSGGSLTTLDVGGSLTAASLTASNSTTVNINGSLSVGPMVFITASTNTVSGTGAISVTSVSIRNNSTVNFAGAGTFTDPGAFFLGDAASQFGVINQSTGTVNLTTVTADNIRIGHFPSETSTYNVSGGLLSVTGTDMTLSWDGNGILNISGGTASLRGLKFNRSAGTGAGTLTLSGGTLLIGASGIYDGSTGANAMTITLNGGTLGASASWSSTLPMAVAGAFTLDTATNAVSLGGVLSGAGSVTKVGAGTLTLSGTNTYSGVTRISGGVLKPGFAGSPLSTNSTVALAGGTLDARSYSNVVGMLKAETGSSTILMGTNDAAVLQFMDSSTNSNVWGGSVMLTGTLSSNSVRFGSSRFALRADQLSLMNYAGRRVALDEQGYVILAKGTLIIVQ